MPEKPATIILGAAPREHGKKTGKHGKAEFMDEALMCHFTTVWR